MNEYTTIKYWDEVWDSRSDQFLEEGISARILKCVRPILFKGSKVLEIGCVPAGRLYFLHKRYGIETYGLDYSSRGLFKSIKNGNHLVCSDLFYPPFKEGSFDFVYSLGVIEHFNFPRQVICKHFDLVRKDGFILITVPNYHPLSLTSALYRVLRKYREVKETHNMKIMDRYDFQELFKSLPAVPLINDYFGPFVIPARPSIRRIGTQINNLVFKGDVKSKFLSPELVYIGKKI